MCKQVNATCNDTRKTVPALRARVTCSRSLGNHNSRRSQPVTKNPTCVYGTGTGERRPNLSYLGDKLSQALIIKEMAITMRTQTLQVFGLARPAQSRRQVARLVVKAQRVQEQNSQQPVRSDPVAGKIHAIDQLCHRGSCCRRPQLLAGIKPAALAAVVNTLAVLPAHADAGKIFDFNLTLPIMTAQFLLLMVFLEKTWFTPVGKALDDRDAILRSKLGSVKDNSGDLKKLQDEAEKVLREARQEAQALIKEAKSKTQDEQGKKLAETKAVSICILLLHVWQHDFCDDTVTGVSVFSTEYEMCGELLMGDYSASNVLLGMQKIDKELESALATLDNEKEEALKDLDAQVKACCSDVACTLLRSVWFGYNTFAHTGG